jgi:tetratricopeptide (TPR) repeat protein
MKQRIVVLVLAMLVAGLCVSPVFAQATGQVRGVCKDLEGKPITGAVVEWASEDTGRKYELKTNAKGEYFSLGIVPGKYKVTLLKDGKQVFNFNGVGVGLDETVMDFDLKKEQAQGAQAQGISPEQAKKIQEEAEKAAKENNTVKALNDKLQAANTASAAGDFDTAITILTEATQMDPNRDLIWFKLGDAYRMSATKQTDPAEKTKRLDSAIKSYEKAVELRQKAYDANPKTPEASKNFAAYYNNLGEAYAKSGKTEDAAKAYNKAAELDPTGAGQYYFNLGAILTNANTTNDAKLRKAAIESFDKAIAIDPNRADAYYWKAVNLIGDATLKGDKMVAPEGTAEAFNKYLELQPTGPHAQEAKDMMASIGATVQTEFGKKTTTKKK